MRTLALIDGEHYPSTVRDALAELPYEFVGAFMAGGTEKLRGDADYGVPLHDDLEEARNEVRASAVQIRDMGDPKTAVLHRVLQVGPTPVDFRITRSS